MNSIKLFQSAKIRSVWNEEEQQWYFSVVDIVGALTDSSDNRKYWNKLKQRLKEEGSETVTFFHQLKCLLLMEKCVKQTQQTLKASCASSNLSPRLKPSPLSNGLRKSAANA